MASKPYLISVKKVPISRKSSNNSLIFQTVSPHFGSFCREIIFVIRYRPYLSRNWSVSRGLVSEGRTLAIQERPYPSCLGLAMKKRRPTRTSVWQGYFFIKAVFSWPGQPIPAMPGLRRNRLRLRILWKIGAGCAFERMARSPPLKFSSDYIGRYGWGPAGMAGYCRLDGRLEMAAWREPPEDGH
jgi:hypothetical protein